MAYGLRYTITQKLRNDNNLIVNIYEKDYVASTVTSYEAISITLEPNSSIDEPLPSVVSSQLNVSFNISNDNDFNNFPNLLSFDDRKYYVELIKVSSITKKIWAGYLFNDYVNVPYTTGNNQVDIVAVDGLSFLQYKIFAITGTESQNERVSYLNYVSIFLNEIAFPNDMNLKIWCSYFAQQMATRGDNILNEPFNQTYQYRRDFMGLDYYTILENMMQSFGCRLFQSNGYWHIMAINEMASDRYYTEYSINPFPIVLNAELVTSNIEIKPYDIGNIYFIDNSQTKISRKGYPTVEVLGNISPSSNYFPNADFKLITGTGTGSYPTGWLFNKLDSYGVLKVNVTEDGPFNQVEMFAGNGPYGDLTFAINPSTSILYRPYMVGPSMNLSFDYTTDVQQKAFMRIACLRNDGNLFFYNKTTQQWSTTFHQMEIQNTNYQGFDTYSETIPLGGVFYFPSFEIIEGLIVIEFAVNVNAKYLKIQNIKLTQTSDSINAIKVTRKEGTQSSIIKKIDIPYGNYNTNVNTNNNVGYLTDYAGNKLNNWVRYGKAGTYLMLANLLSRQVSNLLTKNFGTLEGDLGNVITDENIIYLDQSYKLQDSSTNALSYNGRKFLANRMTTNAQQDQTNGFQLIEVTNTDNTSIEKVIYVGDNPSYIPSR